MTEPFTYTMQGDCLELMKQIPDGYVDLILCDLPYGTTQNKWDCVIDLAKLWEQYKRICNGNIVLTGNQPFTSVLIASNFEEFNHCWIWAKAGPLSVTGHLNAHKMPMRCHEDIAVFRNARYFPQDLQPYNKQKKRSAITISSLGKFAAENYQEWTGYPRTIVTFPRQGKSLHPTQKPVALMEYMIKTYTNEGMIVLDNCMGSGTTGVACVNTKRSFIGIEQDADYYAIACKRIEEAKLANVAPIEAVWV